MKAATTNRKTKPETWGVLAGVVLGLLALPAWYYLHGKKELALRPGLAVSAAQIRAIGGALNQFSAQTDRRPERLVELVELHWLSADEFFDRARRQVVRYGADRDFTVNPDVLYFSALRAGDPNNLVLLCTLLLHGEEDSYHVVFNDGRYEAMNARELIQAINRTYTYISSHTLPGTGAGAATTRPSP
jgi:hypothetical protein